MQGSYRDNDRCLFLVELGSLWDLAKSEPSALVVKSLVLTVSLDWLLLKTPMSRCFLWSVGTEHLLGAQR